MKHCAFARRNLSHGIGYHERLLMRSYASIPERKFRLSKPPPTRLAWPYKGKRKDDFMEESNRTEARLQDMQVLDPDSLKDDARCGIFCVSSSTESDSTTRHEHLARIFCAKPLALEPINRSDFGGSHAKTQLSKHWTLWLELAEKQNMIRLYAVQMLSLYSMDCAN